MTNNMKKHLFNIQNYNEWLKSQEISLVDIAKDFVDKSTAINQSINAFIDINRDFILKQAKSIDLNASKVPLNAVPIAIKSNICIEGIRTTCASKILENFIPPYNATVIDKLIAGGAILFPSANMDEFAFGSSCETSFFGPTKNPWNHKKIPGGSSGGSAAAVSSGCVLAALGSDTGGSIRQPAAMCGVVGLKPTYGRVSRYGLIAFASSLDQIGTFSRTVYDSAKILETIAGHDEKDSTSVREDIPEYTKNINGDMRGMRIGIPEEYFIAGIDSSVNACIKESIKVLEGLGAEIVKISLPNTKYAVSCYYIIAPSEASSNLARYDGAHYGYRSLESNNIFEMYINSRNEAFGDEVKRRVLLGTYCLSSGYYDAYYLRALKVRTKIYEDFYKAFKICDVILTPTTPTTAFNLGEKSNDPLTMYLSDIFTIPANLAGLPAMSVPCGMDKENMPVGMQLMAAPFNEQALFNVGYAFQEKTSHHLNFAPGEK